MTFLARGVCGSLPIVTISGPLCTSFSTSRRILRRSTSRFLSTLAATPEPSLTRPSRMCSVPMYSWFSRCASWLASCITFRARSVNRSYILAVSDAILARRDAHSGGLEYRDVLAKSICPVLLLWRQTSRSAEWSGRPGGLPPPRKDSEPGQSPRLVAPHAQFTEAPQVAAPTRFAEEVASK